MLHEFSDAGVVLLGVMTAVFVGALSGTLTFKFRQRIYGRAKTQPAELPFTIPAIPPVNRAEAEAREDQATSAMLNSNHEYCKYLQNSAVAYLVAASATLFIAFTSSAASVTVLRAWIPFHLYAASLDVASLVIMIWAFRKSKRLRATWVRERMITEFIRQWASTEFLLLRRNGAVTAPYEDFVARTRKLIEEEPREMIRAGTKNFDEIMINAIAGYGHRRLGEMQLAIQSAPPISKDRLRFYFYRRPINQARWFASSKARILRQKESRERLMKTLFGFALLASISKFVAVLADAESLANWSVLLLMLSIGLGTAVTSSYVGQNQRSLGHRYDQQIRAIGSWFEKHQLVVKDAQSDAPLTSSDMPRVASAVVAFEALMAVEAVDWIGITLLDAMELGPI